MQYFLTYTLNIHLQSRVMGFYMFLFSRDSTKYFIKVVYKETEHQTLIFINKKVPLNIINNIINEN